MAKNKSTKIHHYEILYIISNKYTEDELKPIIKTVNKIIEDNEGKITYSEDWGKKKLSYKIQNFNYGYYTLVEFDDPKNKVNDIDKTLRMTNEILRHIIVATRARSDEEIKKEKKKSEELASKRTNKEIKKIIDKKEEIKKIIDKKEEIKKEKPKTQNEKKKIDLKDLDKKLEKILDTNDLL